jgi:fucose permease
VPDERPGVPWRVLVPVATALALYVGVETLLAGWSAVLVRDLLATSPATAALGASAFWVLMSAGRAWGARSAPAGMWPRAATAAALFAAAAAGLLVGRVPGLVLAACAATVLAIAPMYPRLLGLALERLDGRSAARWTGPLVAAGAAGGSLVPALALALGPATGVATFVVAALASLALGAVAPPRRPAAP